MQAKTVPIITSSQKTIKTETFSFQVNRGTDYVFSIAPYLQKRGRLKIFENSIFYENPYQISPGTVPPLREENDISEFSKKSRKRLFDLFNSINYSSYGIPVFLSCTWHYDSPDDRISIKYFLKKFRERLNYNLPPFHYIWKFEYQKRGTPHFHLILFPLTKDKSFFSKTNEEKIIQAWLELKTCKCKSCSEFGIKCIRLETYAMSCSYIAKEIAKELYDYIGHDLGRIWGNSYALRCNPLKEIDITPSEFELFINVALSEIDNKISTCCPIAIDKKQKLLNSKCFLSSLKLSPQNSTIYLNNMKCSDLIKQFSDRPEKQSINTKLILKKYKLKG